MQVLSPPEQIDFAHNKQLLNRYRFIEYETLRILAAWLPGTARMEWKLAMGRLLWEDAQHVQHLYQRLREIQTPAFRPPGDDALEELMAEAIHAPTEADLLGGLLRVIKPALAATYRWHCEQTFANPDAPTLYAFKHILIDEEAQLAWAEEVLAEHPPGEWEAYIADLLTAAGGVSGREERRPAPRRPAVRKQFELAGEAARDERFQLVNRNAGQRVVDPDGETQRLLDFESYSQEMLAAETVAVIIYLSPGMPWAFTYDSARHCYDETRHCKLGIEWLAHHGHDYKDVPQNTRIYAWRTQYDAATQYCLLTMGNETHAFPRRHEQMADYAKTGDRLSAQFVIYDMADERQHVAFGHKWLPRLMEEHGIDRPVEAFVEETVELWKREYSSGTLPLPGEREASAIGAH